MRVEVVVGVGAGQAPRMQLHGADAVREGVDVVVLRRPDLPGLRERRVAVERPLHAGRERPAVLREGEVPQLGASGDGLVEAQVDGAARRVGGRGEGEGEGGPVRADRVAARAGASPEHAGRHGLAVHVDHGSAGGRAHAHLALRLARRNHGRRKNECKQ